MNPDNWHVTVLCALLTATPMSVAFLYYVVRMLWNSKYGLRTGQQGELTRSGESKG